MTSSSCTNVICWECAASFIWNITKVGSGWCWETRGMVPLWNC